MELNPKLLEALIGHRSEPEKILGLLKEAGLDSARLSKINSTADPVTPYSRVVLSAAPECEIMLARWTPERVCAPHDHGVSSGWVFYLEHDFEERSYSWQEGELVSVGTFSHRAGTCTEVRKEEIHSCMSNGSGLSLHVYFPRIEKMRVYDLNERRTLVVADDCGAWIPDRPEQRVAEMAWPG
ncbi:MAG: hypothetical protein JWL90_3645 [Chthoniobacteraceae bacterium]|nr:hypothetical protein [Chthoniobacteraceae bacterium]